MIDKLAPYAKAVVGFVAPGATILIASVLPGSAGGEVITAAFDRPAEDQVTIAELAIDRARRLVELGHDVVVPGKLLAISDGFAQGGFELSGPADSVKVDVLAASGQVIDTIDLGAQSAGLLSFAWPKRA